jgi:hypothetical protein
MNYWVHVFFDTLAMCLIFGVPLLLLIVFG